MNKIEYLALLRGINVGGNNIIRMDDLKKIFINIGFTNVITYIQSGNIIFKYNKKNKAKLIAKIHKALYEKLNNKIDIALLTYEEIKEIIENKPEGFGDDNKNKYDVIYLIEPLESTEAIKEIRTRDNIDKIYTGKKVLYISRCIENLTKSYFPKIIKSPIYKNISIRNWNTTKNIYKLMKKNENDK